MFTNWINLGKSNSEIEYLIRKIYPITSKGYIFSAYKLYKQYINQNNELEYIAMIKKNNDDENIVMVDQNM
jgi:hypothetical protein